MTGIPFLGIWLFNSVSTCILPRNKWRDLILSSDNRESRGDDFKERVHLVNAYTKRTILLKDLKFCWIQI